MARPKRHGKRRSWDDEPETAPARPLRRENRQNRGQDRERRPAERESLAAPVAAASPPASPSLLAAPVRACGRCAEWLADEEGGRGECLHPGSGILKPWWDTPACPFFR